MSEALNSSGLGIIKSVTCVEVTWQKGSVGTGVLHPEINVRIALSSVELAEIASKNWFRF